jgi:hypothetical protein
MEQLSSNDARFDQFKLMDALGTRESLQDSSRAMRILRCLRKFGPSINDGKLAAYVTEKTYDPTYQGLLKKLIEFGFTTNELTGRGIFRQTTVTENGLAFLLDKIGPEPEPVPVAETVTEAVTE